MGGRSDLPAAFTPPAPLRPQSPRPRPTDRGPFAVKTLADFGAEVIKIEPPNTGDPLRKSLLLLEGASVWWLVQSRNKRSLALDLRTPEGQGIVRRRAAEADVLIENFRRVGAWSRMSCRPPTRASSCCASAATGRLVLTQQNLHRSGR